jgi:uncharacterized membrane protein
MLRSHSRLPWLSLLIPLGYLPGYFLGSHPGVGGALAILLATAAAFLAVNRLSRPVVRRIETPAVPPPRAGRPGETNYLPAFNPHSVSGSPLPVRPARGGAAVAEEAAPVPAYAPVARSTSLPGWVGVIAWPLALTLGAWIFASVVAGGSTARVGALGRKEAFSVGIFQQALWWTQHGVPMGVTYATSDASLHRQFGIHFSPLLALLSPLYNMRPEAGTLLWLQALALGLAALPLYLAARIRIGRLGAGLCAVAWWLHPTILGTPLLGFHDLAFAPLFAFFAFWALLKERWLPYALSLVLLLLLREDLAFFVILMGFVASAYKKETRFVMTPILFGGGWLAASFLYIMPHYRNPALVSGPGIFLQQYFGTWGGTVSAAFQYLVAHPLELVSRIFSRDALLYVASILRPMGFLLPLPDPAWIAGIQNLGLNMVSDGNALKTPLARYSIPVVTAFFMALPGALALWGRWLGNSEETTESLTGSVEERGAAVRAAAKIGDLWNTRPAPPPGTPMSGRAGAPAAAIAVTAALLSLFLLRIDRQFGPTPRGDLADQLAVLSAVPDSVSVLAPDYAYARLANRSRFACLGSLEARVIEPEIFDKFDAVVLDKAPGSFEMEKYPEVLAQLELKIRSTPEFRETLSAGGLHLFERLKSY